MGPGGDTHQIVTGDIPALTTQQGMPVADDQNSLDGTSPEAFVERRGELRHWPREPIVDQT